MIKLLDFFVLLVIVSVGVGVLGCRQDWDNQCDKDEECCSKYCRRDNPDWATGVCDPKDTRATTRSTSPMTSTRTTTTTTTTTTKRPPSRGRCTWYGYQGNSSREDSTRENRDGPEMMYTSCGDIFHKNALTASILPGLARMIRNGNIKLPCGTKVRVTNEESTDLFSRSIDIVVNDNMKHSKQWLLSLTSGAYEKIGGSQARNHFECSFTVLNP